jgi:hypothetical protein
MIRRKKSTSKNSIAFKRKHGNVVKKTEVPTPETPTLETPIPDVTVPEAPVTEVPVPETEITPCSGYMNVNVSTALGALPVKDAVVTIYKNNEEGEEIVYSQLITDSNGMIPKVPLPIENNEDCPMEKFKYFYDIYNLRIEAQDFYTVNVLEARIFPDIATSYRIDLLPAIIGDTQDRPDQTFIIPPSPLDESNE